MSTRTEVKTIFYTCSRCHKKHFGHQRKFDRHIEHADLSRVLIHFDIQKFEP
ncbi:hypothetical protein [Candidatus Lokiarchaeum ossiferum]|uniref:hypothetical protein n=1 Tax=Candidatus Lokiarchaeum ossiferum TaxID=2951803 RepID=UPI00352D1212